MTEPSAPHAPPSPALAQRPLQGLAAPDASLLIEAWAELANAITAQAVDTVDHLLRGLELLQQRGRLSAAEVEILARPALCLKRGGMQSQQIARLLRGQVRQTHEKIDLADVTAAALAERCETLAALGITVEQQLSAAPVLVDPTLAYGLVQALLDWAIQHGSHVDIAVAPIDCLTGDPSATAVSSSTTMYRGARLTLSVWAGTVESAANPPPAHSMPWLLAQRLADTDGAIELRQDAAAAQLRAQVTFMRAIEPSSPPSVPPA